MFADDQFSNPQQAIDLYTSAFGDASVLEVEHSEPGNEGERPIKRRRFQVAGEELMAMVRLGAPAFTFTPAISLFVDFDGEDELDAAWSRLAEGASVLMPLQTYDFSAKFGWLADRFGVTWPLNLV